MRWCDVWEENAGRSCTAWCISRRSRERSTTFGPSRRTRSFHSRISRPSRCSLATAPYNCFAIAAPGLEPLVARELQSLGEQPRVESGGVSWSGDARSLMRANLWLRTASRVIVRVASFRATAFFELEKQAKKIPWSDFLGDDVTPEFRVTARKAKLYHSDAIAERLAKAALGARLSAKTDSRERKAESQLFIVRVERDQFTISADSSGELLHMRGYRQATGKAPLRETLAAALLWAANWNGDRP